MKKITLLFAILNFCLSNAQSSWKKINSKSYASKSEVIQRKNKVVKYDLYNLSTQSFKNEVVAKSASRQIIEIPNTKGGFSKFHIKESSNFTRPVNTAYGFIKSFSLQGIDDKTATGKISVGTNGVFVTIYSAKHSTFYIDPHTKDKSTYIAYERKNLQKNSSSFGCLMKDEVQKETVNNYAKRGANDSKLRTYRLALVCTDEYSQFHLSQQGIPSTATDIQKKAAVLSAMNTTITRVNGIYERELAVKLNIVLDGNGENPLIYLTSGSNTLSNNNANLLIEESQTTCDNVIGDANYDIGHTFSTGAGGLAGLRVVCVTGSKARGVTGRSSPINDGFDIDYVTHEIGHQFGANHTFNGSSGNCGGNRNSSTAVEPGSGSTIMGYAGICSPQNVQNNSNDYFHAISIEQMWNTIQSSATCAIETNTNNTAPTANAGADYSVPKSTPLVLKGQGTDSNNNNLTYCWEQIDNQIATMPPVSTNTAGPTFRSLPPVTSPNRYLPTLATVVAGNTSTTWEVLPSVAREINFSFTVRDNNNGGGSSARDDMKITVTDANPFTVTSQNTNVTWAVGSSQNITWDKSTTDQAPINCQNVRIKLSTDGGQTFPIVLVENTPNDGSHSITVPNNVTSTARILIEAVDNIFYNVNSANFTIISNVPTFVLNNNSNSQTVCNNTTNTITYEVSTEFLNGFNENVTFSASNLPNGVVASFSPTTSNTNGSVTMTLSNFSNANAQDYLITITGTSSIIQTTNVNLKVYGSLFSNIALTQPTNGNTNVSINTTFQWGNDTNASNYIIEIAEDINFNAIVETGSSTTNSYSINSPLKGNTTYYWRIKPINSCTEGAFSNVSSFTTETPSYCTSTFTDENGGKEHITNVTFNTINNNSGNDTTDGYEDFTSISTPVVAGRSYELNVSFDVAGFQDHCYVFIDWNQDFIFNNATERYDLGELYNPPTTPSAPGPVTRTITIPENATVGETRMRVLIEYFDSSNPSGTGACNSDHKTEWGETEDYTLIVQNFNPDFTITNTTGNVSVCNKAINQQDFVFNFNTINGFNENTTFSVSGLPANATSNFSNTILNSNDSTTLTLSNLNNVAVGEYTITVTATSASKTKSTNFILNVNDNICKSSGNNNSEISITSVKFETINNTSTKTTGYSDFRAISTKVIKGNQYNLTTTVNTDGNNSLNTIAWIDWNQNCVFDSNEKYNITGNNVAITVPENAETGNTTLRISTKLASNGEPNSCELNFNGEVEDYTITVEEGFATDATIFSDLSVYPIPSDGNFIVNFRVKTKDLITIKTYNTRGRLINVQNFSTSSSLFNRNVVLNNLSSGLYFIEIINGGRNTYRKIIIK